MNSCLGPPISTLGSCFLSSQYLVRKYGKRRNKKLGWNHGYLKQHVHHVALGYSEVTTGVVALHFQILRKRKPFSKEVKPILRTSSHSSHTGRKQELLKLARFSSDIPVLYSKPATPYPTHSASTRYSHYKTHPDQRLMSAFTKTETEKMQARACGHVRMPSECSQCTSVSYKQASFPGFQGKKTCLAIAMGWQER